MVKGKHVVRIMIAVAIIAAVVFAGTLYVNDYYHATAMALEAMHGSAKVEVETDRDYYRFAPSGEVESEALEGIAGIIFYPGAKVEETAYAPLMLKLAEQGYEVYLMRMPARLAILGVNAADEVIGQHEGSGRWIMMGHSLGGAMAASYAAAHSDEVSNLILLAAYSTRDLRDSGVSVLSIYGSEDGVLNMDNYLEDKANLPEDAAEFVIDGGNHAGYAYYGEQEGDRAADISREEQQETTVDRITDWLTNEDR